MKKIIMAVVCAILFSATAFAQQGRMAAGVNLGFAPCLEDNVDVTNFQLGGKFQYNVTDPVRLEAALNYGFEDNHISVLDFGFNVHYLFNLAEKFSIYPLAGFGIAHSKVSFDLGDFDDDYEGVSVSKSENDFMFNIGLGCDYDINEKFTANFEFKYQYIKDFNRMPITVGLAYKF